MHILCIISIYISQDADNENLFNDEDQAYLWLVIISFILVTLMCNSGVGIVGRNQMPVTCGVGSYFSRALRMIICSLAFIQSLLLSVFCIKI